MKFRMQYKKPKDTGMEPLTLVESCWWVLAAWQIDADAAWQEYMESLS